MDQFGSAYGPASRQTPWARDRSGPLHAPEAALWARSRALKRIAIAITVVVLLINAGAMRGESPDVDSTSAEGIASMRMVNPEPPKSSIGKFTKVLLVADAATRMFDAYSTVRMLRNRCGADASVPVCNEEMFLPDAVTRSSATIYGYEGGVWVSQVLAVHQLSRHHRRLARLIPILDMATTLPFAVNNVQLPIHSQVTPMRAQWRIAFSH